MFVLLLVQKLEQVHFTTYPKTWTYLFYNLSLNLNTFFNYLTTKTYLYNFYPLKPHSM